MVGGQHSLSQLDRIAQRYLKDACPKLNAACHGTRDGEGRERVGPQGGAADGVERPRALETRLLDPLRRIGEARRTERRPARAPGGKRDPESSHVADNLRESAPGNQPLSEATRARARFAK